VPGYEILEELGRGGMGVVFKAKQTRLNRLVDLKVVRAGATAGSEELERFRREAEAVAALHHANIVQIYEIGDAGGVPFFALEHVEGGSLADRLRRGPLSFQQTAALVETLAWAMQDAHDHGIVHRDLKPGNVLLMPAPEGQVGSPKISDFGLAKRLDSEACQMQTGHILGTPAYMALEQARGQTHQMGPGVDVYALGSILYECLTGGPPFAGKDPMDTLSQVVAEEARPPSWVNPKVPRDLETICLKCLEKDPARRYPSAGELADDLDRFQEWQPIQARRIGRLERAARWVRRRPAVVLGCLLAVVLVLAGLSGYLLWRAGVRRALAVQDALEVKHEHYRAVVYRQGIPEGIEALSEEEAQLALRAVALPAP
jgi:serine/threonine-protein kinase